MNAIEFTFVGGPADGFNGAGCNLEEGSIHGHPTCLAGGIWQEALYRLEGNKMIFTGNYKETQLEEVKGDDCDS